MDWTIKGVQHISSFLFSHIYLISLNIMTKFKQHLMATIRLNIMVKSNGLT